MTAGFAIGCSPESAAAESLGRTMTEPGHSLHERPGKKHGFCTLIRNADAEPGARKLERAEPGWPRFRRNGYRFAGTCDVLDPDPKLVESDHGLASCLSMIFSEDQFHPRVKPEG